MFTADLDHFLDMPEDAPGPARQMARHLGMVVRAATAAKAGTPWTTALTCRRRPGHRPCRGHIAVFRADLPAPIEWRCDGCGDEGVISGWTESPFDLREPGSSSGGEPTHEIVLSEESVATLQDLQLLDTECERLVFTIRNSRRGLVLTVSTEQLDELLGFVAAEANYEDNPRRQKRLDAAVDVLSDALEDLPTAPAGQAKKGRRSGTPRD